MNHHQEFYAKMAKKNTPHFDRSTTYNGSTEDPQDHAEFYKDTPYDYLPAVQVLSVILLAVIALLSAKYNSWRPSWEEHNWAVLKYYSLAFAFFWSAILAVKCFLFTAKKWWSKILRIVGMISFSTLFIVLGVCFCMSIIFKLAN